MRFILLKGKYTSNIFLGMLFVLGAGCGTATELTSTGTSSGDNACPILVQSAMDSVSASCESTGRNEVCYGNNALVAELADSSDTIRMSEPGDTVGLEQVRRLELSPMNVDTSQWGIALMRLQTNISGTVPGQAVTVLMFGDVALENQTDTTDSELQAFTFTSGIGDAQCEEAPESGILVQTPDGVGEISFVMNNVEISLGSTAFLQAQPSQALTVNVIEGQAEVRAEGVTQTIPAGNRSSIPLDENALADGEPTVPEPYDGGALNVLPVQNLEREITIAEAVTESTFVDDMEGWGIFRDGTEIEHFEADETSDGYVCSVDLGTGVYWYFDAPESFLGNQEALYGGSLNYVIRETPFGTDVQPDVLLVGEEFGLQYRNATNPQDTWTVFSIPLLPTEAWQVTDADGRLLEDPLSDELFIEVLRSLTALRIRGEYVSGSDIGCLDRVQLVAPSP